MSFPWPLEKPSDEDLAAFADAEVTPFWQTTVADRPIAPPLQQRDRKADLCIIGAGLTGLWAALYAKQLDPTREVVILEASKVGAGASSRNGGFMQASITHGLDNGVAHFGDDMRQIEALSLSRFEDLLTDLEQRYKIDAELERTGALDVALEPHQVQWCEEIVAEGREYGHEIELLDRDQIRAEVNSPLFEAGVWDKTGATMVNPAKLVDGLRMAALDAGVTIFEHSAVRKIERDGRGGRGASGRGASSKGSEVRVITDGGFVSARKVLLATSAYPPLLKRTGNYIAPVYDYALMTEPLTAAQLNELGWRNRQGIGDLANQFHYYRLSADNRILWGGYDAVYRRGGPVGPQYDDHEPTFAKLSQHFFHAFPQLEGLKFTHRWGGAIDTCSRFSVFFGTAMKGDLAYALGYTGLGVGASRFGAHTALDLLDGRENEATELALVRRKPIPFPPEPARFAVIEATRRRLAAADRNQGQRDLWLRALDRAGVGFDS